jgi:NADH-quinone oxidoreductase subunit F
VGQAPDLNFITGDSPLARTSRSTVKVDPDNLRTNIPWIFAGGDLVTGPSLVIHATAHGRRAALAIDRYFRGIEERLILRQEKFHETPKPPRDADSLGEFKARVIMPRMLPEDRIIGFEEFETGFSAEQACREASRCLRCDLEQFGFDDEDPDLT